MGYRLLEGSSITRLRGSPNRWEASTNRLIQMAAIEEDNCPSGRASCLESHNYPYYWQDWNFKMK